MIRAARFGTLADSVDAPYLFSAALGDEYLQGFSLKKILKKIVPKPLQKLGQSIEKDFHKAKKWAQDHRKTLQIAAAVIGTAGIAAYAAGGWAALGAKAAAGASSLWGGITSGASAIGGTGLATGAATAAKLYMTKMQLDAAGAQAQAAAEAQAPVGPYGLSMGPGAPGGDSGPSAGGPMALSPVSPTGEPMPGQGETPEYEMPEITAEAPSEGPNLLIIGALGLGLWWLLS